MKNPTEQFKDAMREMGLEPPERVEPGKFHRFAGIGRSNGNKSGWCKMFGDGLGGCYGDWAAGISETWQAKLDRRRTPDEIAAVMKELTLAHRQMEEEREAIQRAAAVKAKEIWNKATPAPAEHPYLLKKGIGAHGTRLYDGALVVPLRDKEGEIHSLQFISPDGEKRFLNGGRVRGMYYLIGSADNAAAICVAEGFATGATLHETTGLPVAVAFNAGNLKEVTQEIRDQFPDLTTVVCADDDVNTQGNPGLTKAMEVAKATGCVLAVPDFGTDRPPKATDFNDMAATLGLDAVRTVVNEAIARWSRGEGNGSHRKWPTPQPLAAKVARFSYPLDALPPKVRAAVEEVQGFTKAPVALIAASALAALSTAAQSLFDVERAEGLTGPVSLYLLIIADSGERKSSCDGYFKRPILDFEKLHAEWARPIWAEHRANMASWEARVAGIKDRIRQFAKAGKATTEQEQALRELERSKPTTPRIPCLSYTDVTPEALAYSLSTIWPSGGVSSAEGGLVLGAHGMGKESMMRNLAMLNVLWEGGQLKIDRRTVESFVVRGARLTVSLQVQEATISSFFERSEGLARGTGFLARFLLAWPESTQGERFFSEPPAAWPALENFNRRIMEILEEPPPMNDDGTLNPPRLTMSPEAKQRWISFHDATERELAGGGRLRDVRDVASKAADNVARLAALFHVFEGGGIAIGASAIESASRIVNWHLDEARRFFGELALPADLVNIVRLDDWLVTHCRRQGTNMISRRDVQRNVTPVNLRQKAVLDEALRELVEAGRVLLVEAGRRKEIHVNPALLETRATDATGDGGE